VLPVQNQALTLPIREKRKVEESPKQPSKRTKEDIQDILNKANQALQKAERLEKALLKPKETNQAKRANTESKKARKATLSLWHQRFRHISEKAVRFLLKDIYKEELTPNHPIGALKEHFQGCELYL